VAVAVVGCETVRGEGERTIGRRRKRGRLKPCARRVVNCRICPRTMAVCCFSVAVDRQTGRNGTRQRGSPGNTHGGTFYSTSAAAGRRLDSGAAPSSVDPAHGPASAARGASAESISAVEEKPPVKPVSLLRPGPPSTTGRVRQ